MLDSDGLRTGNSLDGGSHADHVPEGCSASCVVRAFLVHATDGKPTFTGVNAPERRCGPIIRFADKLSTRISNQMALKPMPHLRFMIVLTAVKAGCVRAFFT